MVDKHSLGIMFEMSMVAPGSSFDLGSGKSPMSRFLLFLARMFHELLTATADMAVLPGVLGCRTLRRTVQVRLRSNTLRVPGGTPIFAVSRQQFMKHPG